MRIAPDILKKLRRAAELSVEKKIETKLKKKSLGLPRREFLARRDEKKKRKTRDLRLRALVGRGDKR